MISSTDTKKAFDKIPTFIHDKSRSSQQICHQGKLPQPDNSDLQNN